MLAVQSLRFRIIRISIVGTFSFEVLFSSRELKPIVDACVKSRRRSPSVREVEENFGRFYVNNWRLAARNWSLQIVCSLTVSESSNLYSFPCSFEKLESVANQYPYSSRLLGNCVWKARWSGVHIVSGLWSSCFGFMALDLTRSINYAYNCVAFYRRLFKLCRMQPKCVPFNLSGGLYHD